jgi:hypothetical protein
VTIVDCRIFVISILKKEVSENALDDNYLNVTITQLVVKTASTTTIITHANHGTSFIVSIMLISIPASLAVQA